MTKTESIMIYKSFKKFVELFRKHSANRDTYIFDRLVTVLQAFEEEYRSELGL